MQYNRSKLKIHDKNVHNKRSKYKKIKKNIKIQFKKKSGYYIKDPGKSRI